MWICRTEIYLCIKLSFHNEDNLYLLEYYWVNYHPGFCTIFGFNDISFSGIGNNSLLFFLNP